MELESVPIAIPDDANVIVGQSHFIKTIVDLHETLAGSSPALRFGAAFCEASGPRLVRRSGNDDELIAAAVEAALAIACGHCFVVFLRAGYPVNVLNALKQVPEVCRIVCATANPLEVLVAITAGGRGIVGVVDGEPPLGVENDDDVLARLELLRTIGYRVDPSDSMTSAVEHFVHRVLDVLEGVVAHARSQAPPHVAEPSRCLDPVWTRGDRVSTNSYRM